MNLEYLKNHEILNFLSQSILEKRLDFIFLDLHKLQSSLIENPLRTTQDHFDLQNLLYGSEKGERVFSGWTKQRVINLSHLLGIPEDKISFHDVEVSQAKRQVFLCVRFQPEVAALVDQRALMRRRNEVSQKVWIFRKQLRKQVLELKSRFIFEYKWRFGGLEKRLQNRDHVSPLWVNLGAGGENYAKYLKVDLSGDQDVFDNIVTLNRIQTVDRIYSNHVLEHIPESCMSTMLKRWAQVLAPQGKIAVRIPNALASVLSINKKWLETNSIELEKLELPDFLNREAIREGILDDQAAIQMIYGWSDSTLYQWDDVNQHKTLWTPLLARKRFEDAGFTVEYAQELGSLNTVLIGRV